MTYTHTHTHSHTKIWEYDGSVNGKDNDNSHRLQPNFNLFIFIFIYVIRSLFARKSEEFQLKKFMTLILPLSLEKNMLECDGKRERNWYRTGKGTEASSYKLVMDCSRWNGKRKRNIQPYTCMYAFVLDRYRSWWISKSRWKIISLWPRGKILYIYI